MNASHRFGRFSLLATVFVLLCLSYGWMGTVDREPHSGPPTSAVGKTPKHVLVIRHAEKPDDGNDIHLNRTDTEKSPRW